MVNKGYFRQSYPIYRVYVLPTTYLPPSLYFHVAEKLDDELLAAATPVLGA